MLEAQGATSFSLEEEEDASDGEGFVELLPIGAETAIHYAGELIHYLQALDTT